MGKGSSRRPTNADLFDNNYDAIFGKKPEEEQNTQDLPEPEDEYTYTEGHTNGN